jgi:hypothetical protein
MATQAIRPVRSLGVGSHRPFDQWGTFLPEHTTAAAGKWLSEARRGIHGLPVRDGFLRYLGGRGGL